MIVKLGSVFNRLPIEYQKRTKYFRARSLQSNKTCKFEINSDYLKI
jgi:hypothetical protein